MTLTDCQLLSIVAQLGTFAAAAERLHNHAVRRQPRGIGRGGRVRLSAVHPHQKRRHADRRAEKLMPAIQQMLASSESL